MKLDARRYPHVTQLMAALKIERPENLSEWQGGVYRIVYHVETDLSHLMPKNPTEHDLDDLADKLSSTALEKELNQGLWQAVRHSINWSETVDVTDIEIDPRLEFGETAEQMREALKKTKLSITVEIRYEMPADVRVAADKAVEDYLSKTIEGIRL